MLQKIQTIATVGLLLIAVGSVVNYGCERKKAANRIQSIRLANCGRLKLELLAEADDIWTKFNNPSTVDSSVPDNIAGFVALEQRSKELKVLAGRVKELTFILNDIGDYCGPQDEKDWANLVKAKYPGLTAW